MYELPIKRAGLSMNRILLSNTKMVAQGFPKMKPQQFKLSFKYRTFENGKQVGVSKCKFSFPNCYKFMDSPLSWENNINMVANIHFYSDFTADDLDDCLPARN